MALAFHKILVPIDFSDTADAALHYGKELARLFAAELHLLHVLDDRQMFAGSSEWAALSVPTFQQQEPVLRDRLERMLTSEDRAGLATQVHVAEGHPSSVIRRYATEGGFELIVMGTHGRGFLEHMLMGSVAEQVVRAAPCPVLTIRHHRQKVAASEALLRPAAIAPAH
jgi:nucleotide-binding universal stress UspA family protein